VTAVAAGRGALTGDETRLAESLVGWLETGVRPVDLFADDAFADLTLPHWRVQAEGADAAFRLREQQHPFPGKVTTARVDRTSGGFLTQLEERWDADGQRWYCRELIHSIVADGRISELVVYCCGDWDEDVQRRHAQEVRLVRP
jgi:hypothetical protein